MMQSALAFVALASLSGGGQEAIPREMEVVGSRLPEWTNLVSWINTPDARDQPTRVLLLRFIGPSCPLCLASLSALGSLHREYSAQGLRIIVVYTPKPRGQPPDVSEIERIVLGHAGADIWLAVDSDWAALRTLWLDRFPRTKYTSVSFVVDASGVVRLVHPGGVYSDTAPEGTRARRDFESLLATVQELLRKTPPN